MFSTLEEQILKKTNKQKGDGGRSRSGERSCIYFYLHTLQAVGGLKSSMSLMFRRRDGPIDEHIWALFQYTPLAPEGLFVSTDFCTQQAKQQI